MGKSLGNFITLDELFHGTHKLLTQAYSPMTIRFFILQAQYRSTLDFSNEALQAAEKGMKKLIRAAKDVNKIDASPKAAEIPEIAATKEKVYAALCDDMNTPVAIAELFNAVTMINKAKDHQISLDKADIDTLKFLMSDILTGVLGMTDEEEGGSERRELIDGLIKMIVEERQAAKDNKQWAVSDKIRNDLKELGVQLKDTANGAEWTLDNQQGLHKDA
jgi:cysteinyl-tRNA synthetase